MPREQLSRDTRNNGLGLGEKFGLSDLNCKFLPSFRVWDAGRIMEVYLSLPPLLCAQPATVVGMVC
jgi:hypothetical protein